MGAKMMAWHCPLGVLVCLPITNRVWPLLALTNQEGHFESHTASPLSQGEGTNLCSSTPNFYRQCDRCQITRVLPLPSPCSLPLLY